MELSGRRAETAALDRAAGGAGRGLVVWGEPGIGKTALLDYAVEAASDAAVLRCRGTRHAPSVGRCGPRRIGR
jgi:predicted ATPase